MRIRIPLGEACRWQDYKAVSLHGQCQEAFLQENERLVTWVNQQPLSTPLICLGDGHDGIWNLFDEIAQPGQRPELLDWFHLALNLHKRWFRTSVGNGRSLFVGRAASSRWLNKLGHGSNFLAHSGTRTMSLKCCYSVALT